MSYLKTNIQLSDVLPYLSSKRHSFFEDEKQQIIQAFMNCPHFQLFRMDEGLKKAIEACYSDINYYLFGAKKILHQYGKNTDNQFFIVKGEANVYEYKKDSELEIECFYTASRSKLKETIDQKKTQLKNLEQVIQSNQSQKISQNGLQSQDTVNLQQQTQKELQAQLSKEVSVLESELRAIEKILDQRFSFFDSELDAIKGYDQFFIDEVCLLKFVKKLKENDSFGIVDNNRDQIIVSVTEIHLTNLTTEVYQINLIPLKATNEFFAFYLKECKLDNYIQFRNLYEKYFNKGQVVYDTIYKPVKGKKGKQIDSDEDSDEDDSSFSKEEQNQQKNIEINTIYLIRRGVFQLSRFKEKRFLPIRTLYPGDFFGIEDLFQNNHQFKVTCQSDKSSVIAYNFPFLKDGLSQNLYSSGEFINTKQKEKLQEVQQRFLQYYVKVYLDVLEQSIENNKSFSSVFAPLVNKIIKKERDPNFRKEEEAREKKFIKFDDIILEMPIEDDAPKGRFDIKLQPYAINMKKQTVIQGQQEQKISLQQPQNLEQQQKQSLISNPSNPNQNNPDMTQLVNKLQIKINSRKQSQEKINLKKKGSQQEISMVQTINSGSNQETAKIVSKNLSAQNLAQISHEMNSQNNRFQQIQDTESIQMTKLKKQQSMTNYSFQPYAAKQNSRDISPQSNHIKRSQKNFTIAPINSQKEQSAALYDANTLPISTGSQLKQSLDIKEVKQNSLQIFIKQQQQQEQEYDTQYLLNSNHNKAIPKIYQEQSNSTPSQQKTKLFKKQFSKTSSKEANSPLSNNYKTHLSYENFNNTNNQARVSLSNFNLSRQSSNNKDSHVFNRFSDNSPDLEDNHATISQENKVKKNQSKKQNSGNSNENNAKNIDVLNNQQNSLDSLPYISQNISSSSLIFDKANKSLNNTSTSGINTTNSRLLSTNVLNNLQMTISQKSKSNNNLSFKHPTEINESNTNKNQFNSYYSPQQKQGQANYQTIPSLTHLDNQNKQCQLNQIYFEGTSSSMNNIPSKKLPLNSQSLGQTQENFMSHSSNKLTSSMIASSNSPQSNKNRLQKTNMNSERFSEMVFSRKSSSQKLINLQQQQDYNTQTNSNKNLNNLISFTSTANQIANNYNKQLHQATASSQEQTHQNSQQVASPKKIKGLLDTKNESRNQLNNNNIQKMLCQDVNQATKSQLLQQNIKKKQNSPSLIESNFFNHQL
ncbi:hypothetical protein TTHERM_00275810 (macronuclear) [Tetrahymena thermophila SB210]|uniref:Cyclic nucleotide-binding domain protein n=1 Tax=Tetrahymena thermophila (strain SB210) TaxID=312017 RepID=I7M7S8_TETTS|nr:hypothetical protein TTHERM_00275810 [Tetrahymena thermophila SB210]EAR95777.1 hypothetical protein TTHERM_00275810 [Tetrahymena thermophila SB210]|eukprot:XP_001016022.1 hypothetical protein TTHERM_00275810 [Tetrahymena thermophila SB210]